MKLPESIFHLCAYDIHRLEKAIIFSHEVSKWSDIEKWEFYRNSNLLSLFVIRMRQDPGFCRYVLDKIRNDEGLISSAIEYIHALKSEWCFNYLDLYQFSLGSSSNQFSNEVISEIINDEIEKFRSGYNYLRPFGDSVLKKAINYFFINPKEDFENKKAATYLIRHNSPVGDEYLLSAYDAGFSRNLENKWKEYSIQKIVHLYNYYPLNTVSSSFVEFNKKQRREDLGQINPFDEKIAGYQGNIPFLIDIRKTINERFNCGFPEDKWISDLIWSGIKADTYCWDENSKNLQDLAFSTHALSIICELWFSHFSQDEKCELLNKSYPFRFDNELLDDMPKTFIDIAITDGQYQNVDTKPLYQYCFEHGLSVTLDCIERGVTDAQYFTDIYQRYCDCVLSDTLFEEKYDEILKRFEQLPSRLIRDFQFENSLQFAKQLNEIRIKRSADKKIGAYNAVFQYYTGDYTGAIRSFIDSLSEYKSAPEYFQFSMYYALSYIAQDNEKGLDIINNFCSSIKNNKLTDIEFIKIFGYELITLGKDPKQYLNPLCTHILADSLISPLKIINIYAELALFDEGNAWCDENISKISDGYQKASLLLAKGKINYLEGKTKNALTAYNDAQNLAEEIYRHDMLTKNAPPFRVNYSTVNGSDVEIFTEKDLLELPDLYVEEWNDQDTLLVNETNALLEIKDFSGVRKCLNKLGKYGYKLDYFTDYYNKQSDVFETFIVVEDYLSQPHIQSDLILNCDDAKTAFITAETLQLKFTKEFDRSEEFDYSPVLTMIGKGVELLINDLILNPIKSEKGDILRRKYSPSYLPSPINNWLDYDDRTMSLGQFANYVLRDMNNQENNFQLFTDELLSRYPHEILIKIGDVVYKIAGVRNSLTHKRIINQSELRSEWNSAVSLVNQLLNLLFNAKLGSNEILPLDSDVLVKLAEICIRKGQKIRAKRLCKSAIKIDPLNIGAYEALASIYKELKTKKYPKTLRIIKKYSPISELRDLARESFEKGNYHLAVEKYNQLKNSRIIKKEPNLIPTLDIERKNAINKLIAAKTELEKNQIQVSDGTHIGFEDNENLLIRVAILNYHTGNFKEAYNIFLNLGIFEKEDLTVFQRNRLKRIYRDLLGEDYRYGYYLAEAVPKIP